MKKGKLKKGKCAEAPAWLPLRCELAQEPLQTAAANPRKACMKEGIHPKYHDVCFVDLSNGFKFVTRSCATSRESTKLDDGREVPLIKLESTSESHPFYTGTQKSVDSLGGRVDKFRTKFAHVGMKKPAAST